MTFRRFLCAVPVLFCSIFLTGADRPAGAQSAPPRLEGTFLQLWDEHRSWRVEDWKALFSNLHQLGMSRLVVQWSVHEDSAFYESKVFRAPEASTIEMILKMADSSGLQVLLGLAHDPQYWEKIKQDAAVVEVYLRRWRLKSETVAREVAPLAARHPSFEGWYISEEIDDVNWTEPDRRSLLLDHLEALSGALRRETPQAKIGLSGFSNANMDPRALGKFWSQLLARSSVDIVLFQDGIGVGKLDLAYLPLYLSAMREAADEQDRELAVVVEVFRQVNARTEAEVFRAVPASLERINTQVKLAGDYASAGIIAFSVPEYMSSRGGREAQKLFEAYVREHSPLKD